VQTTGIIASRVIEAVPDAPFPPRPYTWSQEIAAQTDSAGRFTLRGVSLGIVDVDSF